MASASLGPQADWRASEIQMLKSSWGWYFALGVVLILLSLVAFGHVAFATVVSVIFLGWLMIGGGFVQAAHAFWRKRWSGFFLDLLTGILYLVVGFMLVANPLESAATLTLLIAMFLLFGGIFHIVSAVAVRPPHWGWVLLYGIVSLLLGIAIWRGWPLSGLVAIGWFVGIEMLFNGWSLVMLGLAAKNLPGHQPAA